MKFTILVDTCFWIALLDDKTPQHKDKVLKFSEDIENEHLLVPFPTLYEFVNSRLSRRGSDTFKTILNKPNIKLFDDSDYKFDALQNFFQRKKDNYSDISFVDEILKLIMEDINVHIDYIATFDEDLLNFARSKKIYGL